MLITSQVVDSRIGFLNANNNQQCLLLFMTLAIEHTLKLQKLTKNSAVWPGQVGLKPAPSTFNLQQMTVVTGHSTGIDWMTSLQINVICVKVTTRLKEAFFNWWLKKVILLGNQSWKVKYKNTRFVEKVFNNLLLTHCAQTCQHTCSGNSYSIVTVLPLIRNTFMGQPEIDKGQQEKIWD